MLLENCYIRYTGAQSGTLKRHCERTHRDDKLGAFMCPADGCEYLTTHFIHFVEHGKETGRLTSAYMYSFACN